MKSNQDRIEERILALAKFGENPEGGVSRVAYSDFDIQGRAYVRGLMEAAGLEVEIDAAANIIGKRAGKKQGARPIAFGSHIDSVPGGGNYDGDLGVIAALECIEVLNENNIVTDHPLEVIVFTDEEGGLLGSAAMAGVFKEEALSMKSHSGKTIRQGLIDLGGNPDELENARRGKEELEAFVELHIEQGGLLEEKGLQIGVVEGIVGIGWWNVIIDGFANHGGTTPMNQRQDALIAGAQLVLKVNEAARSFEGRQVATVGQIAAEPGAPNVIPGRVVMSLEIRDLSMDRVNEVFSKIEASAREIAESTGTTITFDRVDLDISPALTAPHIQQAISSSAKKLGLSYQLMPSGAGHDAQDMAKVAPIGMIFVPSVGGISHSPKEFTKPEDMANGADVLLQTILELDKR